MKKSNSWVLNEEDWNQQPNVKNSLAFIKLQMDLYELEARKLRQVFLETPEKIETSDKFYPRIEEAREAPMKNYLELKERFNVVRSNYNDESYNLMRREIESQLEEWLPYSLECNNFYNQ